MKKLNMFLFVCSFALLSNINVFAAPTLNFKEANDKLKMETIDRDTEKEKIKSKLDESINNMSKISKNFHWKDTPTKTGEQFKIYWVKENLNNYNKYGTFDGLISNSTIMWETPLLSDNGEIISTTRVIKSKNKLTSSTGHTMPLEFISFYTTPSNIVNILNSNNIINFDSVKHVRILELYTDIFYVKDGNNEYGIPYVLDSKLAGINNYSVYSMSDLVSKLITLRGNYTPANSNAGGFAPIKTNIFNPFTYSILAILLVLLTITTGIIIYKRKHVSR